MIVAGSLIAERPVHNPSPAHEARVAMLESLAILTGHDQQLPLPLPDGTWPDVLFASLTQSALFMGDAKESEGPGDFSSRARIDGYLSWLRPHINAGRPAAFAVCCPRLREAQGWALFLESVATSEHFLVADTWWVRVAADAAVGAVTLGPQPWSG